MFARDFSQVWGGSQADDRIKVTKAQGALGTAAFAAAFPAVAALRNLARRQGVVLEDELFQALLQHVRVDLRGGDVGVSQQLLHRAQVGAAVQQMAGKGVPQDVRGDAFRIEAGFGRQLLQLLRQTLTVR